MIANRLPSFFVFALANEWTKHADYYQSLRAALETPFDEANARLLSWQRYAALLERQIQESMLGEPFGIASVYVPLRAYYEERKSETDYGPRDAHIVHAEATPRRVVVDLETEFERWLADNDPKDAIRVVCGDPGCGKSSLMKVFAAKQASQRRVLFVPLHLLDPSDDLNDSIGRFFVAAGHFRSNPLDDAAEGSTLLLIVDGLDELSRQGKVGAELAHNFVQKAQLIVSQKNVTGVRLKLLLTGRPLAIQASAAILCKTRQLLYVLPYYVRERPAGFANPNRLVQKDQRHAWWILFGKATGLDYQGLPKELERGDLEEVTSQPLLSYLVALSFVRKKLDFSREVNLNEIYADLVDAVYERAWADSQHPSIQGLGQQDFLRLLEEIGVAVWHGTGRSASVQEIKSHLQGSGCERLLTPLSEYQEQAEAGIMRLLTAFYFRSQSRRDGGDRTFEFTHKTFGEYLSARRCVRFLGEMNEQLKAHQAAYFACGWNHPSALAHWAKLMGPAPLDEERPSFLRFEVSLQNRESVSAWQAMLCRLVEFVLAHGLPMESVVKLATLSEAKRYSLNAEHALLICLNACSRVTRQLTEIKWPHATAAEEWLGTLAGTAIVRDDARPYRCLSRMDLSGQRLIMRGAHMADFAGSRLRHSDLVIAHAPGSDFRDADLRSASLYGSTFVGGDFRKANLHGATLGGLAYGIDRTRIVPVITDFRGVDFREASLQDARLSDVDLRYADLRGANLQGADLRGANLKNVKYRGLKLMKANLKRAQMNESFSRYALKHGAIL